MFLGHGGIGGGCLSQLRLWHILRSRGLDEEEETYVLGVRLLPARRRRRRRRTEAASTAAAFLEGGPSRRCCIEVGECVAEWRLIGPSVLALR